MTKVQVLPSKLQTVFERTVELLVDQTDLE